VLVLVVVVVVVSYFLYLFWDTSIRDSGGKRLRSATGGFCFHDYLQIILDIYDDGNGHACFIGWLVCSVRLLVRN